MTRRNSTKKPCAVFHLDSERGFRGGERQILYLACWLRAKGHANTIVCRSGSPLDLESQRQGLSVLHLPFLSEWDPLSAARLRMNASRAAAPAILHAHTAHTAALAYLATRAGGPAWVSHRRVDFRLSGSWSAHAKYAEAGAVLSVSDAIRDILIRDGVPARKIITVRDCLPAGEAQARLAGSESVFGPVPPEERRDIRRRLGEQWNVSPDAPWIGNLAALVPHKDQETWVRMFALVRRELPQARGFIIGEGPLREDLEALARALGVSDSLRFTGRQNEPQTWLRALDVYAHSSWGEGMGSVLIEAMACRVPIAATTAGGIPEVITDDRNGLLSSPRDSEALARNVLRLVREPALANRLAQEGARRLSDFSLDRLGELTLDAYDMALGESAARSSFPDPYENKSGETQRVKDETERTEDGNRETKKRTQGRSLEKQAVKDEHLGIASKPS